MKKINDKTLTVAKNKYIPKIDTLCKLVKALDADLVEIIYEGGFYE
ncbi:hypothetical protein ABRY18_15165 [Clostridioides difficile]